VKRKAEEMYVYPERGKWCSESLNAIKREGMEKMLWKYESYGEENIQYNPYSEKEGSGREDPEGEAV